MRIASLPDVRTVLKVAPSSLPSLTIHGDRRAVRVAGSGLAARWIGALAVLSMFCCLAMLVAATTTTTGTPGTGWPGYGRSSPPSR